MPGSAAASTDTHQHSIDCRRASSLEPTPVTASRSVIHAPVAQWCPSQWACDHPSRSVAAAQPADLPDRSAIASPIVAGSATALAPQTPGIAAPICASRPDHTRPEISRPEISRPETSRPELSRWAVSTVAAENRPIGPSGGRGGGLQDRREGWTTGLDWSLSPQRQSSVGRAVYMGSPTAANGFDAFLTILHRFHFAADVFGAYDPEDENQHLLVSMVSQCSDRVFHGDGDVEGYLRAVASADMIVVATPIWAERARMFIGNRQQMIHLLDFDRRYLPSDPRITAMRNVEVVRNMDRLLTLAEAVRNR